MLLKLRTKTWRQNFWILTVISLYKFLVSRGINIAQNWIDVNIQLCEISVYDSIATIKHPWQQWHSIPLALSYCDRNLNPLTRAPREGQGPSTCIILGLWRQCHVLACPDNVVCLLIGILYLSHYHWKVPWYHLHFPCLFLKEVMFGFTFMANSVTKTYTNRLDFRFHFSTTWLFNLEKGKLTSDTSS